MTDAYQRYEDDDGARETRAERYRREYLEDIDRQMTEAQEHQADFEEWLLYQQGGEE